MESIDLTTVTARLGLPALPQQRLEAVLRAILGDHIATRDTSRYCVAGASLLRLCATEWLFHEYPDRREGSMTSWRDEFLKYRRRELGNSIGLAIDMPTAIYGYRPWMFAVATEAVFGIIGRECGLDACRDVFSRHAAPFLRDVSQTCDDPRKALEDLTLFQLRAKPKYAALDAQSLSAPDAYTIGCFLCGTLIAQGTAKTPQEAECAAAAHALATVEKWTQLLENAETEQRRRSSEWRAAHPEFRGAKKKKRRRDDNHEQRLRALEERLGVTFKDKTLLLQAISHVSYYQEEASWPHRHYERLEFLGDAVLEWIVLEYMLRKFPESAQERKRAKGKLVSNIHIGFVAAERLHVQEVVLLGYSVEAAIQAEPLSGRRLLADVFEAILGAIYLDQGIGACRLIVDAYLHAHLSHTLEHDVGPPRKRRSRTQ